MMFTHNRQNLIHQLKSGVVCIAAYRSMQSSNDMASIFQQEANFWYLTGIEHADWQLIIDVSTAEEWLVAPQISSAHEIFDGSLSPAMASEVSGIKKIISRDEGDLLLRTLAKKHSVAYAVNNPVYSDHFNFSLNPALSENKRQLERLFQKVIDCQKDLAKLRAIKQPEEITAMQRAIDVTVKGFEIVKEKLPQLKYEYEIEAEFSYYFKRSCGASHAYDPIVAGGKNACTLHYIDNNQKLLAKDFVLLDVGARVDGYAADITRTYAKIEPSKRKQAVHAAVVDAQQEILSLLKPNLSIEEYMRECDRIMKHALQTLGLLKNSDDEDTYRRYFPHAVSHGLGIDVHDSLGSPRYFESGMVLTVEPGIYIPEEGIGVRIEDDILITSSGHRNMSAKLSTDW